MFDEAVAAAYDRRFEKLVAMRDALQLVTRLALDELPRGARVLCVGAGTGAELLYLAEAFPSWRFAAVDPSAPMLNRCRQRAEAAGIADRCVFHEGTVDGLPEDDRYDGATSLLVSQFLVDPEARRAFFRAIADHLHPGAPLVVADLALPPPGEGLIALWKRAWLHAGVPAENVARLTEPFGRDVAVIPPDEVAAIIADGGFAPPLRCFQTLLIHGWTTHRNAS